MTEEERERALASLVSAARSKPNGALKEIEAKIRDLEIRYEVNSETLRRQVSSGTRSETWEICQWLMLLHRREQLGARSARTS